MVRLRASWTSFDRVSTSSMNATLNLTPSMDVVVANSRMRQSGLESFLMTVRVAPSSSSDFCSMGLDLVRSDASISRKFPSVMPSSTSRARMSAQDVFPLPGGPQNRRWGRLPPWENDLSLSMACGCPMTSSRVFGLYFSIQTDSMVSVRHGGVDIRNDGDARREPLSRVWMQPSSEPLSKRAVLSTPKVIMVHRTICGRRTSCSCRTVRGRGWHWPAPSP